MGGAWPILAVQHAVVMRLLWPLFAVLALVLVGVYLQRRHTRRKHKHRQYR